MRSRGNDVRARLVLPLLALAAGCAADKAFALVTVVSAGGAFDDVTQLVVDIRNDPYVDQLSYPKDRKDSMIYRFDETMPLSFSVGYRSSHTGSLTIGVTVLGAGGAIVGYGESSATIVADQVTNVRVRATRGARPPVRLDAGAADGSAPIADGGIAPDGRVSCDPNTPASCNGGTCFLDCQPQTGMAPPLCTQAGTAKAGERCSANEDCVPGAQCLKFGCADGSAISTCLQFCQQDNQCASASCSTPIPCGSADTGYKACAQACDPVGTATVGCAMGLNCFVFQNEVPDCDCASAKRTKGNGDACGSSDECKAGLLCVSMAGTQVCRPLCRLSAPSCASGTCTKLVMPDYKTYGACL
jgi:hypothetical protein